MSLDVYLNLSCKHCNRDEDIFSANITHNLGDMANEAGIYKELWRPEEVGIIKAKQLIDPLKKAIKEMESDPERFKKFNAKNGWGLYEHFVEFTKEYLSACEENPETDVRVSR